jgi:prevent-host-death family protein
VETTISIRELHRRVSEFVNRVRYGGERFVITSRDRPVAVLISVEEYRRLKQAAGKE